MADQILIVDDDPVQRRLLEGILEKFGYPCRSVESGSAALDLLTSKNSHRFSCVILDLLMPEMDGMEVLAAMGEQKLPHPVIVQTAQGSVETAVNAMRAGAVDFVVKPASPQRLQVSIQNALRINALEGEIKRISKSATGELTVDEIISASPKMERVKEIARRAAQSSIPVLIEGESGVGKEMIARAVQGMSERASRKLVAVNCGALPENLAESILFGHEKGAFTGATSKHLGKFQEANGGTLFLDEVGELSLDIQVKLLRALQEGEIDPVGSSRPVKVDFRLISATNRNLLDEVRAGNFREDLFYRLNVLPLVVPPLRDRREDIPALVRHFLARIAAEEGRSQISSVNARALEMLCAYDWPGNIRQLENAVFRAVVLCDGSEIGISEFPQIATQMDIDLPEPGSAGASENRPQPALPTAAVPPMQDTGDRLELVGMTGEIIPLDDAEREIIRFAIELYKGRMSEVARKLGIGRSTLYRKLREYGLDQEDRQAAEMIG